MTKHNSMMMDESSMPMKGGKHMMKGMPMKSMSGMKSGKNKMRKKSKKGKRKNRSK